MSHTDVVGHRANIKSLLKNSQRLANSYGHSKSIEVISERRQICLINNITIMVAWKCVKSVDTCIVPSHYDFSAEEAGFYLSTYKQFEHKPPDLIKERVDKDYYSMLRTALTSVSKVNKTDVETLRISLGVSICTTVPQ